VRRGICKFLEQVTTWPTAMQMPYHAHGRRFRQRQCSVSHATQPSRGKPTCEVCQPLPNLAQPEAATRASSPSSPRVLFIHGMSGYPQEFKGPIKALDKDRLQPCRWRDEHAELG
jgi:hypothetical protein